MARHLFDHASTSPLRPEAAEALDTWTDLAARGELGDPSRIHSEGMRARVALEEAREQVATLIGARPREVVFTSSATESIAMATWGAVRRSVERELTPTVVLGAVEHSAVRESSTQFAGAFGGSVTTIGVDRLGRVDLDRMLDALDPDTALVHIQWGNHEVGTLQPIEAVIARCNELGVLVHIDASQAVGRVPIGFIDSGADLLSFSGHRLGAPSGTGVLAIRRGLRLEPLLRGSDQERGRRAGLEALIPIMGLGAVAASLDPERLRREAATSRTLIAEVIEVATSIGGVELLGDPDPLRRLPHIACLTVDGVEPQAVLLGLDQHGIAAHSGSSCASEEIEPSPVLEAMGVEAARSLRFSVGWNSTGADVDALRTNLAPIIDGLRALAG
ncbi:MAG: cysteine desulfurase [Actinobacteria bacterium]|nr:cysteine desulfurase [Actinomycetota bacterium]